MPPHETPNKHRMTSRVVADAQHQTTICARPVAYRLEKRRRRLGRRGRVPRAFRGGWGFWVRKTAKGDWS